MKKTREMIETHLSLTDALCEVCDARIPVSSRNPILGELAAGKPRVLILNKSDLADEAVTREWIDYFRAKTGEEKISATLALNATSGQGVNALFKALGRIAADRDASGAAKTRLPLRLMIVGVPNSGKSSLINRLTGRRAAQVGDRPGVTRGKQWLTLENGMQLLDTPGILWPKFEDPQAGLNLAFCGSIKDEILDVADLATELVRVLLLDHAEALTARYGVPAHPKECAEGAEVDEGLYAIEEIARKRGYILPGARIDYERAARAVLDEFRSGKLGRISLEKPLPVSLREARADK